MKTICYYITGHGYGHAVRASQVISHLPPDIRVIVRGSTPEDLFDSEIRREFEYMPAEFDCGCLQKDSISVLRRETLTRYRQIQERNHAALGAEIDFLDREKVDIVVSDIPPFPLYAAQRAGRPSFAVTNFTWHDIYAEYRETAADDELLSQILSEYRCATAALITPLATPNIKSEFGRSIDVPLIARRGKASPEDLRRRLGAPENTPVALVYFGVWGQHIDWKALEACAPWIFLCWGDPPGRPPNVVPLDTLDMANADVAASVDAVLAKPGYGTVSQCIADSVPLVYIHRSDFSEYDALVAGMEPWGGSVELSLQDFGAGNWKSALDAARSARINRGCYAADGAEVAAKIIGEL